MGNKNRLSWDQKRKAKLKKRASRSPQPVSLVYHGNKFRRPELLGVYLETEWAIHDSDVMAKQSMIDVDVEHSLEFLIEELRRRPWGEIEIDELQGDVQVLVVDTILDRWKELFEHRPQLKRDDLIGILRTTLGSIKTRGEMYLSPRGYLDYLPKFLNSIASA